MPRGAGLPAGTSVLLAASAEALHSSTLALSRALTHSEQGISFEQSTLLQDWRVRSPAAWAAACISSGLTCFAGAGVGALGGWYATRATTDVELLA